MFTPCAHLLLSRLTGLQVMSHHVLKAPRCTASTSYVWTTEKPDRPSWCSDIDLFLTLDRARLLLCVSPVKHQTSPCLLQAAGAKVEEVQSQSLWGLTSLCCALLWKSFVQKWRPSELRKDSMASASSCISFLALTEERKLCFQSPSGFVLVPVSVLRGPAVLFKPLSQPKTRAK